VDTKKAALLGIVGTGHVLDAPDLLDAYSRDESFVAPRKPWFVVKPKSAEEVQALVKGGHLGRHHGVDRQRIIVCFLYLALSIDDPPMLRLRRIRDAGQRRFE
jgi:hypothetical protein